MSLVTLLLLAVLVLCLAGCAPLRRGYRDYQLLCRPLLDYCEPALAPIGHS